MSRSASLSAIAYQLAVVAPPVQSWLLRHLPVGSQLQTRQRPQAGRSRDLDRIEPGKTRNANKGGAGTYLLVRGISLVG